MCIINEHSSIKTCRSGPHENNRPTRDRITDDLAHAAERLYGILSSTHKRWSRRDATRTAKSFNYTSAAPTLLLKQTKLAKSTENFHQAAAERVEQIARRIDDRNAEQHTNEHISLLEITLQWILKTTNGTFWIFQDTFWAVSCHRAGSNWTVFI